MNEYLHEMGIKKLALDLRGLRFMQALVSRVVIEQNAHNSAQDMRYVDAVFPLSSCTHSDLFRVVGGFYFDGCRPLNIYRSADSRPGIPRLSTLVHGEPW